MGKLFIGILGGFSGTVGTVVGSTNKKGDDIIRAKTKRTRTSNTEGQVNQRTKFGLVTGFMQAINFILKFSFKLMAGDIMSPYNYACQNALTNAVVGAAPDFELDYSKVLISEGKLSRAPISSAILKNGKIEFGWSISEGSYIGNTSDNAFLVVYNVDSAELSYSTGDVNRGTKAGVVALPYAESGDKLLCYLFFQSATDELLVSNSVLAGTIEAA